MSAVPVTTSDDAVIDVRGLGVRVGDVHLVSDVTFSIGRGERVGLIGESGSGKSLTGLSLLGLLPEDLVAAGSVRLPAPDLEIVGAGDLALSRVRGRDVAMVFQEPMTALNPTMRVGDQVTEALLIHRTVPDRAAARQRTIDLLEQVRLPDPADTARAYPHQLSGGQRQRVVLAIAVLAEAALSFLGLGTPPPTPSWGRMLQESQELLFVAPRLCIIPGIAIAIAVLGFNLLGDGLRDYLDPRLDDRR